MSGGAVRPGLRLDLVSPLPPVRSGIADYAADLLPELESLCDVRVIRLAGQPVAPAVTQRWQTLAAERTGEAERLPLYQMGNNLYHEQVLDLALERPGVVVLHDLFLHHLLIERTLARGQLTPYREWLEHDHGWIGAAVAKPPRWGAYATSPLFCLPCHRRLVQSQRGVLVHSDWAADRLREEVERVEVRVIPMPIPLEDPPDREAGRAARRRWGIPENARVLGSFGFQTPIKRTGVVIETLTRPGLEAAHLLVVGQVSSESDLEHRARELGVADRVHLCGFVERRELGAAMAATDLCLNLRYPSAGETSASLLRLLAMSRPTVVSDYAQFAELPDDCVLKAPLGEEEPEALAELLATVLERPAQLVAVGEKARRWVARENDPALAARRLVDAVAELASREPPGSGPGRPDPPTTLTWGHLSGHIDLDGSERSWKAGESRNIEVRIRNTGRARWLAGRSGCGGVAIEVRLEGKAGNELAGRPWPPLPRDLAPGEEASLRLRLRRPPGPARLRIEPHVLGVGGFARLGGPVWESQV